MKDLLCEKDPLSIAEIIDMAVKGKEPIRITRDDGKSVVVLTNEQYCSLTETAYLMGNENNARHLKESIAQLRRGKNRY